LGSLKDWFSPMEKFTDLHKNELVRSALKLSYACFWDLSIPNVSPISAAIYPADSWEKVIDQLRASMDISLMA